jgi:hypothetical protein
MLALRLKLGALAARVRARGDAFDEVAWLRGLELDDLPPPPPGSLLVVSGQASRSAPSAARGALRPSPAAAVPETKGRSEKWELAWEVAVSCAIGAALGWSIYAFLRFILRRFLAGPGAFVGAGAATLALSAWIGAVGELALPAGVAGFLVGLVLLIRDMARVPPKDAGQR